VFWLLAWLRFSEIESGPIFPKVHSYNPLPPLKNFMCCYRALKHQATMDMQSQDNGRRWF
jgi:hypothetical protein